jgi:uncharacterized protein YjiS (DUF1127 family)
MIASRQQRATTVAAALYPVGAIWPAKVGRARETSQTWWSALAAELRRLSDALAARRARRDLMALDDRMLKDIGLSRSELLGLDLGRCRPAGTRAQRSER